MWPWVTFDGVVIVTLLMVSVRHFNNAIMALGVMIAERRERICRL